PSARRPSTDAPPPPSSTGSPAASRTSRSSARSGPSSEPSRRALVTRSPSDPGRGATAGELGRVDPASPRPALADDLPVAGVDRDDQAVGEARRERLERGRSGDDAGGSCREPSLDRARGA